MPLPALAFAAFTTAASAATGAAADSRRFQKSKELAYYQNQLNVDQWWRENLYNSPANQMKRLREAGLNPQLVNPSGNLSASSPSMVVGDTPDYGWLENIGSKGLESFMSALQIENLQAQVSVTQQEARLKKLQADAYEDGDFYGGRTAGVWQGLKESEKRIEKLGTDINYRQALIPQIEKQIELYNSQISVNQAKVHLTSYQVADIVDRIDYRAVQEQLALSQVAVNQGRISLMDAQKQAIALGLNSTYINNLLGLQEFQQRSHGKGYSTGPLSPLINALHAVIFGTYNTEGSINLPTPIP